LLTSHGDYWLGQRRLMQKGFRADKLAAMTAGMQASLDQKLADLDAASQAGPVNVYDQMVRTTFAMFARSLFSTSMTDDEIGLISDAIRDIQGFVLRQIVQPHLRPWFVLSGELRRYEQVRLESDEILMRQIRRRRIEPGDRDDLLQVLFDARYDDTGLGMSDEQILNECRGLLVAGHETSSNALSWALYLLSQHPEYLQRARDELQAVAGDGAIQAADLPRLPLMAHILDESMRLYPPFWMVDREAVEDDQAAGVTIPAGTTVIAFIFGAHRSALHWDEPERFLPERFDKNERTWRRGFNHLPFGGGPRSCLGSNYAMLEMVLVLAAIVRTYDFELAQEGSVTPRAMVLLRPKNGVWMRLKRIGAR
jgi:cytochrome P450